MRVEKYDENRSMYETLYSKIAELFSGFCQNLHQDKYECWAEGDYKGLKVYGDVQGITYQLEISKNYRPIQRWQGHSIVELEVDVKDLKEMADNVGEE